MNFTSEYLSLNLETELTRVITFIKTSIVSTLRKKGVVVAVSGGIDSSTTAALCARALGPDHVLALLLPERDSSPESLSFGKMLVEHLGIRHEVIDIAAILEAMGCYRYRDDAIREIIPEYTSAYRNKIALGTKPERGSGINFYSVIVESPQGIQQKKRLPLKNYLQIVAATNMKQRTRKSLEYFHADRLNFAVVGTPNFLEYDQGFFVKLGDGAADIKPIAHLYKTQVYAMARHLGLPAVLCDRRPTTDTYSLEQTQEEFYFQLPHEKLDLLLYGMSQGLDAATISRGTGIPPTELDKYMDDVRQKRVTTAPLHVPPLTLLRGK